MVGIVGCWCGSIEDGFDAVRPLKDFGPPAIDLLGPMPYRALQSLLDATAPSGLQNYWRSDYLHALGGETIDTVIAHAREMRSPLSQTHIHHMGGAVERVGAEETAFGHREAPYLLNAVGMWTDPAESQEHISWVRRLSAAVQPYSTGVYVNFLGNEGAEVARSAYDPEVYERLVALKTQYDPTNLFRLNQNIKPRSSGQRAS
jgi:FAD/FMN-containing dehydrogenase